MAVRKYSIEWWVLLGTLVGMAYGGVRVVWSLSTATEHNARTWVAKVARDSVHCCKELP